MKDIIVLYTKYSLPVRLYGNGLPSVSLYYCGPADRDRRQADRLTHRDLNNQNVVTYSEYDVQDDFLSLHSPAQCFPPPVRPRVSFQSSRKRS